MKFTFLIFVLGLLQLVSCHAANTRMRVTGGTIRLLSYSVLKDGVIQIRQFQKGDTTLGIGVFLDVETFVLDSPNDTNSADYYGPVDTILSADAFFEKKNIKTHITHLLKNDSTHYIFDFSQLTLVPGRWVDMYSTTSYGVSELYQSLQDFMNKYNSRSLEYNYYVDGAISLRQEFYFWINDSTLINNIQEKGVISLQIEFNDRIVKLNGVR